MTSEPFFETAKVEESKTVLTGPDRIFADDNIKTNKALIRIVFEGSHNVGREFSERLFLRGLLLTKPEQFLVLFGELLDWH